MIARHHHFVSGWLKAIHLYEGGKTWTQIRKYASEQPEDFGAGVLAGADALEGMFASARQFAHVAGISHERTEELILRTLDA